MYKLHFWHHQPSVVHNRICISVRYAISFGLQIQLYWNSPWGAIYCATRTTGQENKKVWQSIEGCIECCTESHPYQIMDSINSTCWPGPVNIQEITVGMKDVFTSVANLILELKWRSWNSGWKDWAQKRQTIKQTDLLACCQSLYANVQRHKTFLMHKLFWFCIWF